MREILQKDEPLLREKAQEVDLKKIASSEIKKIIKEMKEALAIQTDGVAIAAPQIGYPLRIFVVSKKVFDFNEDFKTETENEDMVFINPEIVSQSKKAELKEEGCLSCRYLYGKVKRKEKTRVRAYGSDGKIFEYGGSGLMSQIFQHEIDHLEGVLFIDKAENLHKIDPEDLNLET